MKMKGKLLLFFNIFIFFNKIVSANNDKFIEQLRKSFNKNNVDTNNLFKYRGIYPRGYNSLKSRQDGNNEIDKNEKVVSLSCESEYIQKIHGCGSSDIVCISSNITDFSEFNMYLKCDKKDVEDYGHLINYIFFKHINEAEKDYKTYFDKLYNDITVVARQTELPLLTDGFFNRVENNLIPNFSDENKLTFTSSYLGFIDLIDKNVYSINDLSVGLCNFGYGTDIKLYSLYQLYDITSEEFDTVCHSYLSTVESENSSKIYPNENQFINSLDNDKFLAYLKEYYILNFGLLFNTMVKEEIIKPEGLSLAKTVYQTFNDITEITKVNYENDDTTRELERCIITVTNRVRDNSHFSYCLCKAGYNAIDDLQSYYSSHGITQEKFDEVCQENINEENALCYKGLGKSVQECVNSSSGNLKKKYNECLDEGLKNGYLRQIKCLCEQYNGKWKNDNFLTCYGYTEFSFTYECRKFYPNQMFSDNPARGMDNYNSTKYDTICGDSGTGGGYVKYDPCICKIRKELDEVSYELNDICERIGTESKYCNDSVLSKIFSTRLLLISIFLSIILYF